MNLFDEFLPWFMGMDFAVILLRRSPSTAVRCDLISSGSSLLFPAKAIRMKLETQQALHNA
jgi:hypothetical protein